MTGRAVLDEKTRWRTAVVAARREIPGTERAQRAAALTTAALRLAATTGGPVCAYVPVGSEPGSPELVSALHEAGHEVLLPVVAPDPGPLDWAAYTGPHSLAPAPFGLREPTGPRLGPEAVTGARLVLVPGLAADLRGVRLGRGAGHYDRTLALAAPDVPIVIVLNDDEVVERLPAEPHDRPVTGALLPGAGLVTLGNKRRH